MARNDDEAWLAILSGREEREVDPATRREAEITRAAILLEEEAGAGRVAHDERGLARLLARLSEGRSRRLPLRAGLGALAAAAVAALVVFGPWARERGPEPESFLHFPRPKGSLPALRIVDPSPERVAREIAEALRADRVPFQLSREADKYEILAFFAAAPPEAAARILASHGLEPGGSGHVRIEIAPGEGRHR